MKKIVATAYAVNPWKGSEDGTGWNLACQIARFNEVTIITRKNNQEPIECWLKDNVKSDNLSFRYFDLPYFLRFWKRGEKGALPYFYLWQAFVPLFIRFSGLRYDILHNLNFHNDWTPTFLGFLGKPLVWGPIGHHPPIPKAFVKPVYGSRAFFKDRLKNFAKRLFWTLDPFFKMGLKRSNKVICLNSTVQSAVKPNPKKVIKMPAVACKAPFKDTTIQRQKKHFTVLSIGRFVPLKGFDVTIRAFGKFLQNIPKAQRPYTRLILIGKGPEKARLQTIAKELEINCNIEFLDWMPREELDSLYRQADLFLFPSHEGAGMVIPEALSYGLPTLVFDNSGPGELINNSCGFKIPYGKYEDAIKAFAKKIDLLFSKPELRKQMAQNAIKYHSQYLTWT